MKKISTERIGNEIYPKNEYTEKVFKSLTQAGVHLQLKKGQAGKATKYVAVPSSYSIRDVEVILVGRVSPDEVPTLGNVKYFRVEVETAPIPLGTIITNQVFLGINRLGMLDGLENYGGMIVHQNLQSEVSKVLKIVPISQKVFDRETQAQTYRKSKTK